MKIFSLAFLTCLICFVWAVPVEADPYNRGGPKPRGGPKGGKPPMGQPAPRVPQRPPDAVRQRTDRERAESARQRQGQDGSEAGPDEVADTGTDAPQDVGDMLEEILDQYDAAERDELGSAIMEEWLDRAGSDKPPDEVLQEAIDAVLSERGVDQATRDAAGEAATEGIWGSDSAGEDHPHGPDATDTADTAPETPEPTGPVVRVDPDQAERIARDELADGASPERVQQVLDELNETLGGSGSVPAPDLTAVQTEGGQTVVMSSQDAEDYNQARQTAQDARETREGIREQIDHLNGEIDKWREMEENVWTRTVIGIGDIWSTFGSHEAEVAAINDQIDSLNQEPRPQVIWHHDENGNWVYGGTGKTEYGGQVYDSWDAAESAYDRRGSRIRDLEQQRAAVPSDEERIERMTRTRTGEPYTNRADRVTERATVAGIEVPTIGDMWAEQAESDGLFDPRTLNDRIAGREAADTSTPGGGRTDPRDTDVMRTTASRDDRVEGSLFNRPAENLSRLEGNREAAIDRYGRTTDQMRSAESTMQSIVSRNR